MEPVQVFLKINNPGLNNEWNEKMTSELKELAGIEDVQIIEKNESSEAQINIGYDINKTPLEKIEHFITNTGATIIQMNIHFPSSLSGVTDAYGASAISIKLDEKLNKLKGVAGVSISSTGIIKVNLDTSIINKQSLLVEIIGVISTIRFN